MTDKVHFAIMGPEPTDADIDDFLAALGVMSNEPATREELLELRYSPDQPRVPAGSSEGGEWTSLPLSPTMTKSTTPPTDAADLWQEVGADGPGQASVDAKIAAAKDVAARLDLTDEQIAGSEIGKEAMSRYNGEAGYPKLSPKEAFVAYMHDRWAESSGDGIPSALALQRAVAEEFGLKGTADPLAVYHYTDPVTVGDTESDLRQNGDLYRAYARAEYANTQAFFKAHGMTELPLYRGIGVEISEAGPLAKVDAEQVATVRVQSNPLSSWSVNHNNAAQFADWSQEEIINNGGDGIAYEFSASIPVSRIFSTPMTGAGCLDEYEAIILGGQDDVSVYRPR